MGETPLIIAVQQRHVPVIRLLLEAAPIPTRPTMPPAQRARLCQALDARGRDAEADGSGQAAKKPGVAGPKL
jgi:ankyrin repeat protein